MLNQQLAVVERQLQAAESQRRRLWPRAALVGLISGALAVTFRAVLNAGDALRDALISHSHTLGWAGYFLPILFGAFCGWAGVYLVQKFAPEASGSGIPHLEAVLHGWRGLLPWRLLPVKFFGGALAITGGLALGREGPSVQMGGAAGKLVGQWTKATRRERRTLISAGAGAVLAAAFNAPLAGMMFVLEEIQKDFRPAVLTATFVACIIGDVVTRLLVGPASAFRIAEIPAPSLWALPLFVVLGLISGFFGVLFNRSLLGTLKLFERAKNWPKGAIGGVAGAAVGAAGLFNAELLGSGHELAEHALSGHVLLQMLPWLFLARFVLTMGSYSTGAAGGIFAPLLVLGAQLGLACGLVVQHFVPGLAVPAAFAVVGMAAYFTAIVRAPLTGIVLIAEMTGGYSLILPLLAASLSAYAVAEFLRDTPIYEALLERSLGSEKVQQLQANHQ